jgi:hypothetical protein
MKEKVRLRYLWDSQTIIAVNGRGEVVASESVARLIVGATRRQALVPPGRCAYELDAIRQAVIAEAHLAGLPAPRGWTRRVHGKDVHTSKIRDDFAEAAGRREENCRRITALDPANVYFD